MKRTSLLTLLLFGVFAAAAGWLIESAIVASGSPMLVPPVTLAVALGVIGVVVFVLALPVRRAVRERDSARIDPFYATRVVVLAKASGLAGALFVGLDLGVFAYLLTRPIVPGVGSIVLAIAAVIGSIVLLLGGLLAERMCTVPPDDDDRDGTEIPVPPR